MFDLVIENEDEFLGFIDGVAGIEKNVAFIEALIDAALIVEERAKEYLLKYIYDKPERGYSRKMGAGLFGKTMATKKVIKNSRELTTGVGSFVKHALYVHYGTGRYAQDGKGRKTPWVYKDAHGKFHKTVGQIPKPYLVDALIDSKREVLEILAEGLNF